MSQPDSQFPFLHSPISVPSSHFSVPSSQFLVIGYGNPLRTDDRVGQVVVDLFAGEKLSRPVQSIACHQLLPEHAELVSEAGRVIFVDAAVGAEPGRIEVRDIEPDVAGSDGLIHDFTPQTLLAYAYHLYGKRPQATLVTVAGFSFEHGDRLSPEMTAVLPQLLTRIRTLILA